MTGKEPSSLTTTTKLSEEEQTANEFAEAINLQKTDSMKVKLLHLYSNQHKRDEILEKGYNEEYYTLEYAYNQRYSEINNETSSIVGSGVPIPLYWRTVIENAKFWEVNEKDKEILKYLTNVEVVINEQDKKSITVFFHFTQNSFFDHTVLSKMYKFSKKDDKYSESKSTEIVWKGDNPTLKIVKKKIKKGKNVSVVTKEKKVNSFFGLFEDKEADQEDNEEEEEADQDKPDLSSEAEFIINDLVPFSVEYYLNLMKFADDGFAMPDGDDEDDDEDQKPKKKK